MRLIDSLGYALALDAETTGTDPETARLVQVCLGRSLGAGDWTPLTRIVRTEVPDEAAKIHGITTERAMAEGGDLADVLSTAVLPHLYDAPLVGHNLAYDLTVLDRECRRVGLDGLDPSRLTVIDTLVLGRRIDRSTAGTRLESIAGRHGIKLDAHKADEDALASLKLLYALIDEDDMLGLVDVADLQGLQARWYHAQTLSRYYRRRGSGYYETAEPSTEWPLVTWKVPTHD